MSTFDSKDIILRLREAGTTPDEGLDLAELAMMLSQLTHPGISTERYFNHIGKMGEEVGWRYRELITAGAQESLDTRLAALKHILADQYAYTGDDDNFDGVVQKFTMEPIWRKALPKIKHPQCGVGG